MHAIASSTSERMPIMCDGSSWVKGNRKPVALVSIVNSRNIAVRPGIPLEPSSPNITMMPDTIAIRLMMTCTVVNVDRLIPKIMTIPLLQTRTNATTPNRKLPHATVVSAAIQACGFDQKGQTPCPSFLHGCHKQRHNVAGAVSFDALSLRDPVSTPGSSPRACFARKRFTDREIQPIWESPGPALLPSANVRGL